MRIVSMSLYEKNLEALKQHHPELVELLESPISTDHIQVVQAESGASRLLVQTSSGETRAVHNAIDPEQAAHHAAQKVRIEEDGLLVLLGMGLGYLPKILSQQLEDKANLIVYEADPGIFKTAVSVLDLTSFLTSPRIKVLVGPDANLAQACLNFFMFHGIGPVQALRY